jgi:ubiquinone/menaquinone biosynthesis C-methylase UbiE
MQDMVNTKMHLTDDQSILNWDRKHRVKHAQSLWENADPRLKSQIMNAIELLRVPSDQAILEVPCDNGRNTILLAQAIPFLVAMDASHKALALAHEALAAEKRTNVLLQQGNIYDTGFFSDSFAGVFCWDLLSHLQQPDCALSEMLRVCKPGCRVIGSFFSTGDAPRDIEMTSFSEGEEYLSADQFYFRFYTEPEVRRLLSLQTNAELVALYTVQWTDSPHESEREYPNDHESWVFILEKKG